MENLCRVRRVWVLADHLHDGRSFAARLLTILGPIAHYHSANLLFKRSKIARVIIVIIVAYFLVGHHFVF